MTLHIPRIALHTVSYSMEQPPAHPGGRPAPTPTHPETRQLSGRDWSAPVLDCTAYDFLFWCSAAMVWGLFVGICVGLCAARWGRE